MLSIGEVCLRRPVLALPVTKAHSGTREPAVGERLRARVAPVVPEHVLVTTDGSDEANRAIPIALAAIRACGTPRVTLLRVLTPAVGTPVHALESAMARAHAEAGLDGLTDLFPAPAQVKSVVAEGSAADQILHFAETNEVDLIVIASHGSDEARTWPTGGITRKVVISGVASVLVVPTDPERGGFASILVPLDCSARSECVLPIAAKLAAAHDAELVLAHVVPRPDIPHRLPAGPHERELIDELTRLNRERAEGYLDGVRDRLLSQGIRVRVVVLSDTNPGRAIEQLARDSDCDLIVACAHGSGCQHGERYGSTARRLLDSVAKPVWIIQDLPVGASTARTGRTEFARA